MNLEGIANLDLDLLGSNDTVFIKGNFIPSENQFSVLSLDYQSEYNTSSDNNIIYDIIIPIEGPIRVNTEDLYCNISGDLNLVTSLEGDYSISGLIDIIDGYFYDKPGNKYYNLSGNLIFSPNSEPHIDINAQTNIIDEIVEFVPPRNTPGGIYKNEEKKILCAPTSDVGMSKYYFFRARYETLGI